MMLTSANTISLLISLITSTGVIGTAQTIRQGININREWRFKLGDQAGPYNCAELDNGGISSWLSVLGGTWIQKIEGKQGPQKDTEWVRQSTVTVRIAD